MDKQVQGAASKGVKMTAFQRRLARHYDELKWLYCRLWDSLKSHIELYGMTAINFRTTFATMMVASGVDIKTTQALMGHSTPEMTLKVYAKKEASRLPEAMKKMEVFLAG